MNLRIQSVRASFFGNRKLRRRVMAAFLGGTAAHVMLVSTPAAKASEELLPSQAAVVMEEREADERNEPILEEIPAFCETEPEVEAEDCCIAEEKEIFLPEEQREESEIPVSEDQQDESENSLPEGQGKEEESSLAEEQQEEEYIPLSKEQEEDNFPKDEMTEGEVPIEEEGKEETDSPDAPEEIQSEEEMLPKEDYPVPTDMDVNSSAGFLVVTTGCLGLLGLGMIQRRKRRYERNQNAKEGRSGAGRG